ncbi:Ig-like domain-containing protein [Micromonospora sp. NPDC049679]|uniref:L,D-transpeptidase n=1 Tax=Micromonospora sp. NPDC049679 TaxID=3155920 RepID=UPI0033C6D7BA
MRASRDQLTRHVTGLRRTPAGRVLAASVLAAALALTSACTGGHSSSWQGGGSSPTEPPAKASATITGPAADAKDVPASAEITFTTKDATKTTFELKDAAGKTVEGALTKDGGSWLPDGQLDYNTGYTATVTVTDDEGKTATTSNTFTTMARPGNLVQVSSFLGDGAVVGVGMPLIVKFGRAIPQDYRDDVQRRMTVKSTPAQEGIWHWISGTEVHYRPKEYWKGGTAITYKLQTGGLPMGSNWYGRSDLTVDLKIGSSTVMIVDNKNKTMTVRKDGKVVRTIPISLGKAKTPSSSGTMIVMEKLRKTVFDTFAELGPKEGYRTDIEYAQRLTWGGEFIHAAPWSVAQQGRTNVSHGCVNMSMANAQWLFNQTTIGDPITVKGTERALQNGNGWTVWNLSWDEYVKGSAIPYEPPPTTKPTPDHSASPSADASPAI